MKRMALLSVALLLVQVINLCHLLTASCLQGPDFKSDPSKLTKVFFMALNYLPRLLRPTSARRSFAPVR